MRAASFKVLGASLRVLPAALTVLAASMMVRPGAAQGRFTNVKAETRSAARGLEPEIRAVAARGGVAWIGYRVPMVAGPRQMCCYDTMSDSGGCCGVCRLEGGGGITMTTDGAPARGARVALESPTELLVLARLGNDANGAVNRVRLFTPDCDVDAGAMPVVWLTDVRADQSIAWLSTLATSARDAGQPRERVAKQALAAIALHDVPAADRALEGFVAPAQPEWLRSDTAFWLGSARGEPGARLLARMIQQDPADKVREKVTFGLSVSQAPSALTTLITAAKEDKSARVRGQALFWLAHKAGRQAIATIADAIERDPETEVKRRAVFALSQLPKDEGVPRLIDVARTNRNPEVRKQAFFWLGQSKDPRAVQFFEEILLKK
ncbi:MAG TPA: HEAT repeat domain-containing protein [Vicinamibacterales bacterium]|nr:HEAT repeat domain-containing protein [Vicinamibacterales bacterium]